MVCFAVSLLLVASCVRLVVSAGVNLAEYVEPLGMQIPGSANVTLINVTASRSLPEVCETTPCFPKCCPFGQSLVNRKCTPVDFPFEPKYSTSGESSFNIFEEDSIPIYIIIGEPCYENRFSFETDEFVVLANGTMVQGMTDEDGMFMMFMNGDSRFLPHQYCLDSRMHPETNETITVPIYCETETRAAGGVPIHVIAYPIGLLISVCFLLITMLVYLVIPDLRDLQGMTLVCHLVCQALAYLFLSAVQLSGEKGLGEIGCNVVAYMIQLLFSGSFFWLNVMCFDAMWYVAVATLPEKNLEDEPKWWWKLHYPGAKVWEKVGAFYMAGREDRDVQGYVKKKQQERRLKFRVFFAYSVYAWFFTFLPTILVLIKELGPTIPNTYLQYNLVNYNCDFENISDKRSMPYFYTPVGIILFLNAVMFTFTIIKSINYPWNTNGPHRIPRQKARMCYMLFFLMALNWLTDIIAWACEGEAFMWSVLNVFNILQGVVTFFIFVLEDRVKLLIIDKLWPSLKKFRALYPCCDVKQPQSNESANETTTMLNDRPDNSSLR